VLLEKFPKLKPFGDIISFSSNSGRIFQLWEGIEEELDPISHKSDGIDFMDWHGTFIIVKHGTRRPVMARESMVIVVKSMRSSSSMRKARGIDIRLDQNVTDYFETDDEAGVVANGVQIRGDVVFAAEGVRSRGRKIVLGYEDQPRSTDMLSSVPGLLRTKEPKTSTSSIS
jgi:2-polyprenyl-6-methoxyphenol hydroxylase-like FAD-dependent oxidoreductase